MTSSCVPHLGPGAGDKRRGSEEYTVTNIELANKRGNKNLFKTALEKLSKKYRKHKKISDNLYEVIVVYKDSDELEAEAEAAAHSRSMTRSEPTKRKVRNGPTPPPRTRSRSQSRQSVRSTDLSPAPTPPPRSRRNSRVSYSRLTFSHDTIPPTPPPRSRPHSRNSCRGGSLKRTDNIINEKRRPPLAPPRSPVVKEKKVRKKIRDDDIKGILESVIARVSETDLTRLCEDDNEDNKESDHLNQKENGEEGNPSEDILDSLYAFPVKQKMKDSVTVTAPEEEDTEMSSRALMMSTNEESIAKIDESNNKEKTATENLSVEKIHKTDPSLSKHEAMKANNARMDNLWSNIKHASNLSLNKVQNNNNDYDLKETHIGAVDCDQGTGAQHNIKGVARSQSFTQLTLPDTNNDLEKDETLKPLTPQDRVKRSLERLDLPDWYKDRSLSPGQGPAIRKTSWTDGDKSRARTRDRSLPPPSPLPSRNRPPVPNIARPVSPPSPMGQLRPYLGWRSQERLPTFLDTEKPTKIEDGRAELNA